MSEQTFVETWTCSNCGALVLMNQPHTCPTVIARTSSQGVIFETRPDWQRITQLLEQIARDVAELRMKR